LTQLWCFCLRETLGTTISGRKITNRGQSRPRFEPNLERPRRKKFQQLKKYHDWSREESKTVKGKLPATKNVRSSEGGGD